MSFLDVTNDAAASFAPLPVGKYNVNCLSAEVKETKAKTGEYISVTFEVMEGPFRNKKLFTTFNIKNPNPKAVEIGRGQLKSFMENAGLTDFALNGVGDLEGLKTGVKTKIRKDEVYGDKAEVSYYCPPTKLAEENTQAVDSSFTADDIPF